MFAAEPLGFLPTTHAAEGGEMRSSYFKNTPPTKTRLVLPKRVEQGPAGAYIFYNSRSTGRWLG